MTDKRTEFSSGADPPSAPRLFGGLRPLDRAGAGRDALAGVTLGLDSSITEVLIQFM